MTVIPAFAAGQVQRNAALRAEIDAERQVGLGAVVLCLWKGLVPLRAGGGLWLAPKLADRGGAPDIIYLGSAEGTEVFAQNLGEGDTAPALPDGCDWTELRQCLLQLSANEAELVAASKALFAWHASHRFCSACGHRSDMAMAGWQRTCPACQAQHFPRTDPVVIMLITSGDQLLLGRSPGWPEGMYSTLAGFMEPGETVEAAVRREVAEETGIEVGEVRYLSSQPWPFPASLMLGCHGTALTQSITLDPAELEDALWVTRSEMVAILSGDHPSIKPMRPGAIAHSLVVNWLADLAI